MFAHVYRSHITILVQIVLAQGTDEEPKRVNEGNKAPGDSGKWRNGEEYQKRGITYFGCWRWPLSQAETQVLAAMNSSTAAILY